MTFVPSNVTCLFSDWSISLSHSASSSLTLFVFSLFSSLSPSQLPYRVCLFFGGFFFFFFFFRSFFCP